jgi:thioredoxin 1
MSGKVHFINDKTFDKEVLQETSFVLVDYWLSWCDSCQKISPVLEKIAQSYASHIKTAKLDVDECAKTQMKYGVQNIPTLMLFRNGEIIARKVGPLSKGQLITFIEGNVIHKRSFNY